MITLPRPQLMSELDALVHAGGGVVIGVPGAGKSWLLKAYCEAQLAAGNRACIYLPVDELPVHDDLAFTRLTSWPNGDPLNFLTSLRIDDMGPPGILVLDAYDAARNEDQRVYFLGLATRVVQQLPGWAVLVSARTYDARKASALHALFPLHSSQASQFVAADVPCRHRVVPLLTSEEIDEAMRQAPHLRPVVDSATQELRTLLHVPFHLTLMLELLDDVGAGALGGVRSEVELLGLFWHHRVDSAGQPSADILLTRLANRMVASRSLTALVVDVFDSALESTWNLLMNAEVIAHGRQARRQVVFAHNILFDYAVSLLLIDDDPEAFASFVREDPARPFFLRPSLHFFFARLWHENRDAFWRLCKAAHHQTNENVRLALRLIPPTVVVQETRAPEALAPVLQAVHQGDAWGSDLMAWILQGAHTLGVDERTTLWADILDAVTARPHQRFVWDATLLLERLLDQKELGEEVIRRLAQIAGRLYKYAWELNPAHDGRGMLDPLAAHRLLPIVCRTAKYAPAETVDLLAPLLELVRQPDHYIPFISQVCHYVKYLIPVVPTFVGQLYLAVFEHQERSEDRTHFGGIVLPMSSTRRQDYQLARYSLTQTYPAFIKASLSEALAVGLRAVDAAVLADRKITDPQGTAFPFRGGRAVIINDYSYIWGSGSLLQGAAVELTMPLVAYLRDLMKEAEEVERPRLAGVIADIYRDNARVAYSWRYLLELASQDIGTWAPVLLELAEAPAILGSVDLADPLKDFLSYARTIWTPAQLERVTDAIERLPTVLESPAYGEKRQRDLQSAVLGEVDGPPIAHELRQGRGATIGWFPTVEESDVLSDGEDLAARRSKIASLNAFYRAHLNDVPTLEDVHSIWSALEGVSTGVLRDEDPPLSDAAFDVAALVARAARDLGSEEYNLVKRLLLRAAELPRPSPDVNQLADVTSFSSAARNAAAQGLPWLLTRAPDPEVSAVITRLAEDPSSTVRYLLLLDVWRIVDHAQAELEALMFAIAVRERNSNVQVALVQSMWKLRSNQKFFSSVMQTLAGSDECTNLNNDLTSVVMYLHIVREEAWATTLLENILKDPLQCHLPLAHAVQQALGYIEEEVLADPQGERLLRRSTEWICVALPVVGHALGERLADVPRSTDDPAIKSLYGVLSNTVARLRFSVKDASDMDEQGEIPGLLANAARTLVDLVFVQAERPDIGGVLAPTAHDLFILLGTLMGGDARWAVRSAARVVRAAEASGYQNDSMAEEELVTFVTRLFADHREVFQDEAALHDVVTLLEVFVRAGSAKALQLVWRLDEAFR